MNSPEKSRPWQKGHGRTVSRREFLQILVAAGATGAAISLGLSEWGRWNSGKSFEQTAAEKVLERAEREGNVTEFKVVNPDGNGDYVNVRKNPAIFEGNRLDTLGVGESINKGFLVSSTGGREKYQPNLRGPWVAFEVEENKIGFVYSGYVKRSDGQELTKGLAIYNLVTGSAISWDSTSSR